MTNEDAIKYFEHQNKKAESLTQSPKIMFPSYGANELAIAALQAQAERDNPKALSLEELRERVGKVVYIHWHNPQSMPWVEKFSKIQPFILRSISEKDICGSTIDAITYQQLSEQGIWWEAYDYKPKGGTA